MRNKGVEKLNIKKLESNIEFLSKKVHESWEKEKRSQGFHSPNECQSDNHVSYRQADWRAKERFDDVLDGRTYKWCDKCHENLYPFEELPENIKEYDRVTVRTVLNAIKEI